MAECSRLIEEQARAELEARRSIMEASASASSDFFRDSPMIPSGPRGTREDGLYVYRWLTEKHRFARHTRDMQEEEQIAEGIAAERRVSVCESAIVSNESEPLKRVRFVVAEANLTREIVDATIGRFLDHGERNWQGLVRLHFEPEELKTLRAIPPSAEVAEVAEVAE